ncbi:MAG TPA: globin domain-containing protein [Kofleriaceae bacterium]|nr:globin domain-containing protein [Kofleriaceae bacterium]
MALNAPLLRESFALVTEREPRLVNRFYEILFERYPQARPLFGKNSGDRQAEMLRSALVAVLDHLEDEAWIVATLKQLGAKHVDYAVTDEMYGWVGESLIAAMAEVADADWTPEHTATWADAYGVIATLMQQGGAEVVAERAARAPA